MDERQIVQTIYLKYVRRYRINRMNSAKILKMTVSVCLQRWHEACQNDKTSIPLCCRLSLHVHPCFYLAILVKTIIMPCFMRAQLALLLSGAHFEWQNLYWILILFFQAMWPVIIVFKIKQVKFGLTYYTCYHCN